MQLGVTFGKQLQFFLKGLTKPKLNSENRRKAKNFS